MDRSLSSGLESEISTSGAGKRSGSWVTFPFIIGTFSCLTLAGAGWLFNIIVYLIKEFNVKSIDAAQISNVVNGGYNLVPLVAAIVADSFLGSFSVVAVSSCVSFVGLVLLASTALLDSLRPKPCEDGSSPCQTPSKLQYAILYGAFVLASIGMGGSRYTLATMGANQFDNPKAQGIFFNWFFFMFYLVSLISATAIVYIEDNVGWGLGLGLCVAANFIGIVIFLVGTRFYRRDKPQGSPFTSLARVVVAAIQKRKVLLSSRNEDYYYDHDTKPKELAAPMSKSFRFFNRAALKSEGDIKPDGSIAKPWRLCTVSQVEDFKTLIRIFPIWSTSIFLGTPIAMQSGLNVLQALTMDRHLGQHFKIPAGSIFAVIVLLSASIFLSIIDRFLFPLWLNMTHKSPTPFQRIGVGHVLNVLAMAVSAAVESSRLRVAHHHNQARSVVPMSALWLFPQLILIGVGEAFHFPGQVALYYQEFPTSLRSTATAMISLIIGISFYLSTALIDLIRKVTGWLPDNINDGRLDNVYWVMVAIGVLNFGYFLGCAKLYKYQNVEKVADESSSSSDK